MTRTIGFVGLGNMGMPISLRLVNAGHRVIGCDIRQDMRTQFTAAGGVWADTPCQVADLADVVMVSLSTPAAVEAVALGPHGLVHGKRMKLYVDLSTTGPQVAKRVAGQFALNGVVAFDAPVSGGIYGGVVDAGQGTLTLMASGPTACFPEVKALLECFGKKIFYVGEQAGQGHLMKLLNNLLSTTAMAVTYEAMTVGAKAGLDPQTMLDVLSVSSGTNHAVEKKIPKYVLPGVPIGFSLDLSYKDVALAVEAGEALNMPMRMGRTTCQIWHQALCKGDPKRDYLQVVKLFEEWGGVNWTPPAPETSAEPEARAKPES